MQNPHVLQYNECIDGLAEISQSRQKAARMMTGSNRPPNEVGDWQYRNIFDAANDGLIVCDGRAGFIVDANPAACAMHGYRRDEFIGLPLETLVHLDNRGIFNEFIRAFKAGGEFDTRALHVRRDGSTFHGEWHVATFEYQGRPCLLGMVRDVSKRIEAEQGISQRAKTRMREQAALLGISHTLASTLELQPGLILDQLREIIEYDHAGLFSLDDSSLVTLAMRGTPQLDTSASIRIRLNRPGTLAKLFNQHRPIRIADVWSDDPQAQFLHVLLDDGAAALLEGMHSWMWVPLAVKSRIIGGVGVAHKKKKYFTPHHADLALSVANQAAITMMNAELYGHAQELAVLEERQRLARDLHDAVNQSLFSAGLIAEVLPRLWDRDQGQARSSLEDLRKLTRGAMAEMRALLAELRPATLIETELGDLLRLLGNAFTGRTNIPSTVTVEGEGVLPAEVQVATYRVCQEALNNVTKHAAAKDVQIALRHEGTGIDLTIRDDGKGFDPDRIESGHYGLTMMRERAEGVGAQFAITSQPGRGTELTIRWRAVETKEEQR